MRGWHMTVWLGLKVALIFWSIAYMNACNHVSG
jgi:hypothetical protein